MNLLARINELVSNPSCVYDALETILQSCETPEDVTERTWLTVKLSICEFLAARVEFPEICRDQFSLAKCTRLLETKATWWTTYSGNYRQISVICSEYQPQAGARKALEVLSNATDLFGRYEQDQRGVLAFSENAFNLVVEKWSALSRNLSTGFSIYESQLDAIRQSTQFESTEIHNRILALDLALAATTKELQTVAELGRSASNQSAKLLTHFQQFESTMNKIQTQHLDTAEILRGSVNQTMSVLEATNKALERYARNILAITNTLRLAFSILGRTWLIFLVPVTLLAIWVSSRRKKSAKPTEDVMTESTDPIFF